MVYAFVDSGQGLTITAIPRPMLCAISAIALCPLRWVRLRPSHVQLQFSWCNSFACGWARYLHSGLGVSAFTRVLFSVCIHSRLCTLYSIRIQPGPKDLVGDPWRLYPRGSWAPLPRQSSVLVSCTVSYVRYGTLCDPLRLHVTR